MTAWVALLRAVNLGAKRKVAMADLRRWCAEAGCEDVATYIQSGNVVFTHPARSARKLEAELGRHISQAAGFDVPVMLRSAKAMAAVVERNPFAGADPKSLHVAFLAAEPGAGAAGAVDADGFAPDEFVIAGREVYLHLPRGMAGSKLPGALSRLKTPATVRTWATVGKLHDLASKLGT